MEEKVSEQPSGKVAKKRGMRLLFDRLYPDTWQDVDRIIRMAQMAPENETAKDEAVKGLAFSRDDSAEDPLPLTTHHVRGNTSITHLLHLMGG